MDGRLMAALALALIASGCVTTTETQSVTVRNANNDPPPSQTAKVKEEPLQPVPPRMLLAWAEMKEKEADGLKDNPDLQAKLRDEARKGYQELLRVEPDQPDAYRGLARLYCRMGDYERAQETYGKALAKHPRDVNLWHDYGMLHDRRKDFAEGVKCFRKALEIDPEHQRSLKALGFTLARMGQIDQCLIYLTRAMGSAASAHYNVAQMLLHLAEQDPSTRTAREELARQHLRRALQENPNLERAREMLTAMDALTATRGTVEIQFATPNQ